MVHICPYNIGYYDPQLLAHVFSVSAFYLYFKWVDELTLRKTYTLSFLCCFALFIKHLLVSVPVALAITLFFNNRGAFRTFALSGTVIFCLMLFGTWLYGGNYVYFNFIDFYRPVSNYKSYIVFTDLFLTHFAVVLFLPFTILLITESQKWMSVLVYFFFSFLLACYVSRGEGVGGNVWFDFFIATSIIFGLFAANNRATLKLFEHLTARRRRVLELLFGTFAVFMILSALLINEFIIARYLSSDGVLERSTILKIRMLQITLGVSGIVLLLGRQKVAASADRLPFYGILASCLLPLSINLEADLKQVLNYDQLKSEEKIYREDVDFLRGVPGPGLYEDVLLGIDAGKEILVEPCGASLMMVAGRVPEEMLINPIREKYFHVVALGFDLERKLNVLDKRSIDPLRPGITLAPTGRWTDNTLQALSDNYKLIRHGPSSYFFFYVPRAE